MKDSGLGTPAPRASISETLPRGHATRDGKARRATERGIGLIALHRGDTRAPPTVRGHHPPVDTA